MSDHSLITASVSAHTRRIAAPQNIYSLNYSKTNKEELITHMDNLFVQNGLSTTNDVCASWNSIKQAILSSCRKFIPRAKVPTKPSPRWFNSEVRHQLNKVHTLRKSARRNPTAHILDKLSQADRSISSIQNREEQI